MSLFDSFRKGHNDRAIAPALAEELCSEQSLQSAVNICTYFAHKLLGSPLGLTSINEAVDAALDFFNESYHTEGRTLFIRILKASADDCHLDLDREGSLDRISLLYERMREYLIVEALSFERQKRVRFDDVDTQLAIAFMYRDGNQVKKSAAKAAAWFQKAASQNNTDALFTLGKMYLHGEGVSQDIRRSINLLTKAADLGDEDAPTLLGSIYCSGDGVLQDFAKAINWLRKGAMLGVAHAQGQLGYLYAQGLGVTRDVTEAFAWMHLCAESGHELGSKNREVIRQSLTREEQQRGLARAEQLRSSISAATAHRFTTADLMNKAFQSKGAEAVKWLTLAAERGDGMAACWLAGHYRRGDGVTCDPGRTFHWYMRAASAGDGSALFALVELYATGEGVDQEDAAALMYFYLAEEHGFRSGYKSSRQDIRRSFRDHNYKEAYAIAAQLKRRLSPAQIKEVRRAAANSKLKLPSLPPLPGWVCAWDELQT